jgi:hypothetical protein
LLDIVRKHSEVVGIPDRCNGYSGRGGSLHEVPQRVDGNDRSEATLSIDFVDAGRTPAPVTQGRRVCEAILDPAQQPGQALKSVRGNASQFGLNKNRCLQSRVRRRRAPLRKQGRSKLGCCPLRNSHFQTLYKIL